MVQAASSQKNLWVAASDGDIERVRILIEGGMSPNDKDSNSYTPMHAAASYAHLELLEYLISAGGNVNIADADGETPLFTIETLPVAVYLIEQGADIHWRNNDGQTAAEYLEEDHPELANYLRSVVDPNTQIAPVGGEDTDGPSALALDNFADSQTSTLLQETQRIMEEAERNGEDPEEKLRLVVERAVRDGIAFGGGDPAAQQSTGDGQLEDQAKRRRDE